MLVVVDDDVNRLSGCKWYLYNDGMEDEEVMVYLDRVEVVRCLDIVR